MALTDNIVSYYKMDDDAATTAVDDELDNNEGTATFNTDDNSVAGKIGTALSFDGSEYVDIGTMGTWGGTLETFTITAWVKVAADDVGYITGIINTGASGSLLYLLVNADGTVSASLREEGSGTVHTVTSSTVVDDDAWHFLTATNSGSAFKIYVNGGAAEDTITDTLDVFDNFDYGLTLGARNNRGTPGNFITGDMDEIGIWDRALSDAEIAELYNSGDGFTYPFVYTVNETVTPTVLNLSTVGKEPLTIIKIPQLKLSSSINLPKPKLVHFGTYKEASRNYPIPMSVRRGY